MPNETVYVRKCLEKKLLVYFYPVFTLYLNRVCAGGGGGGVGGSLLGKKSEYNRIFFPNI